MGSPGCQTCCTTACLPACLARLPAARPPFTPLRKRRAAARGCSSAPSAQSPGSRSAHTRSAPRCAAQRCRQQPAGVEGVGLGWGGEERSGAGWGEPTPASKASQARRGARPGHAAGCGQCRRCSLLGQATGSGTPAKAWHDRPGWNDWGWASYPQHATHALQKPSSCKDQQIMACCW